MRSHDEAVVKKQHLFLAPQTKEVVMMPIQEVEIRLVIERSWGIAFPDVNKVRPMCANQ